MNTQTTYSPSIHSNTPLMRNSPEEWAGSVVLYFYLLGGLVIQVVFLSREPRLPNYNKLLWTTTHRLVLADTLHSTCQSPVSKSSMSWLNRLDSTNPIRLTFSSITSILSSLKDSTHLIFRLRLGLFCFVVSHISRYFWQFVVFILVKPLDNSCL